MTFDVFAPRRVVRLLASDWANTRRDPTLLVVILFALVPSVLLWVYFDRLTALGSRMFGWEMLSAWMVPVVLTLPPILIGWVIGFLFLEERDDGPLESISVTVVGQSGLLTYRAALAWTLSAILTFIGVVLLLPEAAPWLHFALSMMVGLEAVVVTALLPAIAKNKVEGLALTKVFNIGAMVPLAALIPSPAKYVLGVVPTFWVGEALYSEAAVLPLGLALAIGAVVHVGAVWIVFRRVAR